MIDMPKGFCRNTQRWDGKLATSRRRKKTELILDDAGLQLQEIDEYLWSGIDEPPETRGKGKERGKKRKVLNRKISEKSGSWRERGMGCPWGLRDLCLLWPKWSSTVYLKYQSSSTRSGTWQAWVAQGGQGGQDG